MTTPQTPAYVFTTAKGSFSVTASDLPKPPHGRAARLRQATIEALPVILARLEEWTSQNDEPPMVVIATADSIIGQQQLAKVFGPPIALPAVAQQLFKMACGPFVHVQALGSVEPSSKVTPAMAGAPTQDVREPGPLDDVARATIKALGPQKGDVVVAFAVNHTAFEFGLMRFDEGAPSIELKMEPAPSGPPTLFAFTLTGEPEPETWLVAIGGTALEPQVMQHPPAGQLPEVAVTFTLSRDDASNLVAGHIDPMALYRVGRLGIAPPEALPTVDAEGAWKAFGVAARAGTITLPPPPAEAMQPEAPAPVADKPALAPAT